MRSTRWRNILKKMEMDGEVTLPPSLMKDAPVADLATFLDFVRFHSASGNGLIDDSGLITVESSNGFMEQFCAGFTRVTGTIIDKETRSKVYKVNRLSQRDWTSTTNHF